MSTTLVNSVTSSRRLLSKKDLAGMLGYTVRTIDRLIEARKIPYLTLPAASGEGRKVKFDSTQIDAWLASGAVTVVKPNGGES